jgi:hypothetical protein
MSIIVPIQKNIYFYGKVPIKKIPHTGDTNSLAPASWEDRGRVARSSQGPGDCLGKYT